MCKGFAWTEARLGLKSLGVWCQSWVMWVPAGRCMHTEVVAAMGSEASALAVVGGGCEAWHLAWGRHTFSLLVPLRLPLSGSGGSGRSGGPEGTHLLWLAG